MNSLISNRESIYGFSYLTERFLEEPFFLGVDGLSGGLQEESWTFNSNPASCSRFVCDNYNLEDMLVYFMHVAEHYRSIKYDQNKYFDTVLSVMFEILKKMLTEIAPAYSDIHIDTMMAAYNLTSVFNTFIKSSYGVLSKERNDDKLKKISRIIGKILNKIHRYHSNNHVSSNYPLLTFFFGGSEFRETLLEAMEISRHNDLKIGSYIATCVNKWGYLQQEFDDCHAKTKISVVIMDDNVVNISKYRPFTSVDFDTLRNELSNRDTHLKTFAGGDENSIINCLTLSYNEKLINFLRGSSSTISVHLFRKMTKNFNFLYSKQRLRIYDGTLFKPEETQFIFQFSILVLEYLKRVPKYHPEAGQLVQEIFSVFGDILNSIKYSEINDAISLKTSAILSKTLEELVEDALVQNIIKDMRATIMFATTKITYFVGMIAVNKDCTSKRNRTAIFPNFPLTPAKPIENVKQISKIRKSRWSAILADSTTSRSCDQFYNRDTCPVCLENLIENDSCFLFCKHIMCYSCTKKIIDNKKM